MRLLWACLNFTLRCTATLRIAHPSLRATVDYPLHKPLQHPLSYLPHKHLHKVPNFWNSHERIELDSSELDLALRFLTQVGIILHFECEIAGLDELYFIDPAWACRTISEIVLSSKVKNHIEESGFITSEDRFQNLVRWLARKTGLIWKPFWATYWTCPSTSGNSTIELTAYSPNGWNSRNDYSRLSRSISHSNAFALR